MRLVATNSLRYGTRHLQAGEMFEARDDYGRVLIAIGKARESDERKPANIPPPPASLVAKVTDIKALRAAYTKKLGKKPWPGWSADELRRRMAS